MVKIRTVPPEALATGCLGCQLILPIGIVPWVYLRFYPTNWYFAAGVFGIFTLPIVVMPNNKMIVEIVAIKLELRCCLTACCSWIPAGLYKQK